MTDLPAIERPNGRLYRPRKIIAHPVSNGGDLVGALVLGTRDVARAQALADACVAAEDSGYVAADPVEGWWRDAIRHGERFWAWDDVRGRAGVFWEIVERSG